MAYNILWNDDELVLEFYQERETNQYTKVFEERLSKDESIQLAQRIMRVTNLKMPKKDKLLKPTPQPPTNDMSIRDVDELIKNE